jgi:hypothetical protein
VKRLFWFCIGLALIAIGVIGKRADGASIAPAGRAIGIAGGAFVVYVALMYYLPKHRRRRKELDALIEDSERQDAHRRGGQN